MKKINNKIKLIFKKKRTADWTAGVVEGLYRLPVFIGDFILK